jgi:import inner membrane translocase subunit TIM16
MLEHHADASKSGMTAEGLKQASKVKKNQVSLEEARQILGIGESATWEEIEARFRKAFEANEKNGSFYLQSKIFRAHERLQDEYQVGEEGGDGPQKEGFSS